MKRSPMSPMSAHDQLLAARDYILAALTEQQIERPRLKYDEWVVAERLEVTVAANDFARAYGISRRVTCREVEAVEQRAVGHVDYSTKFALYVAELIVALP